MILVLGWGVVGAAVATVIGNMAASLFYLGYFLRKRSSLSINIHDFKLGENIPFSVASIGIPASLNNILMSCANMVLNQMLASYGDTPVAAMGVATKVNMLVVLLQIGLCAGIQPLIGYNYGARKQKTSDAGVPFFRTLCSSHGYRADIAYGCCKTEYHPDVYQ